MGEYDIISELKIALEHERAACERKNAEPGGWYVPSDRLESLEQAHEALNKALAMAQEALDEHGLGQGWDPDWYQEYDR